MNIIIKTHLLFILFGSHSDLPYPSTTFEVALKHCRFYVEIIIREKNVIQIYKNNAFCYRFDRFFNLSSVQKTYKLNVFSKIGVGCNFT